MSYEYFLPEQKLAHEENMKKQREQFPNRKFLNSYKYFENHDCVFFPCHPDSTHGHNCMFCKCPLYHDESCVGIQNGDGVILENGFKDCTNCTYNHEHRNAEEMMWVK